jgi:hypothetical protein
MFLGNHPLITHLSLDGCGLAPITKEKAEVLRTLISFTGSFEHCSVIAPENSLLDQLTLTFKCDPAKEYEALIDSIPPTPQRSVTRVIIRAVPEAPAENIIKCPRQLGIPFYWRLGSFFPNITHLDIVLGIRLASSFITTLSFPTETNA